MRAAHLHSLKLKANYKANAIEMMERKYIKASNVKKTAMTPVIIREMWIFFCNNESSTFVQ